MNQVIYRSNNFEYVGNRFKNPDLIRLMNNYYKNQEGDRKGIGRITSQNAGEFFSLDFINFYGACLANREDIEKFFQWIRYEFLESEYKRQDFYEKYEALEIAETLFLIYDNAIALEANKETLVDDVLNRNISNVLNNLRKIFSDMEHQEYTESLEEMDVVQGLEETIDRGFFPISEEGELLIYMNDSDVSGEAVFLSIPSNTFVIGNKYGVIKDKKKEESDIEEAKLTNEEKTEIEEYTPVNQRSREEKKDIYPKMFDYHSGGGIILTSREAEDYIIEFETWSSTQIEDRPGDEDGKYLQAGFTQYLKRKIEELGKIGDEEVNNVISINFKKKLLEIF